VHVSVIGLAGSGKTTLLEALSGTSAPPSGKNTLLTVRVPDPRVNKLSSIFKPKKTTFAELRMQEIPWASGDESNRRSAAERYVKTLAGAELLLNVVRDFESPFLAESPDPQRDLRILDEEMLLADLVICENFFDRIRKIKPDAITVDAMTKAKQALEEERFLFHVELTPTEKKALGGLGFSTMIRQLIVVNTPEDRSDTALTDSIRPVLSAPLGLAKEVAELPDEEQREFLADLGFTEPVVDKVCRDAYAAMNLISFFTVGEDECRAWTVEKDAPAQKAAGKIHSDLERGFIRAEVAGYDDFIEHGSMKALRDTGKLRVEGKTYPVQDGDIINVRFNV
jgi:ribosome-binding ATPase